MPRRRGDRLEKASRTRGSPESGTLGTLGTSGIPETLTRARGSGYPPEKVDLHLLPGITDVTDVHAPQRLYESARCLESLPQQQRPSGKTRGPFESRLLGISLEIGKKRRSLSREEHQKWLERLYDVEARVRASCADLETTGSLPEGLRGLWSSYLEAREGPAEAGSLAAYLGGLYDVESGRTGFAEVGPEWDYLRLSPCQEFKTGVEVIRLSPEDRRGLERPSTRGLEACEYISLEYGAHGRERHGGFYLRDPSRGRWELFSSPLERRNGSWGCGLIRYPYFRGLCGKENGFPGLTFPEDLRRLYDEAKGAGEGVVYANPPFVSAYFELSLWAMLEAQKRGLSLKVISPLPLDPPRGLEGRCLSRERMIRFDREYGSCSEEQRCFELRNRPEVSASTGEPETGEPDLGWRVVGSLGPRRPQTFREALLRALDSSGSRARTLGRPDSDPDPDPGLSRAWTRGDPGSEPPGGSWEASSRARLRDPGVSSTLLGLLGLLGLLSGLLGPLGFLGGPSGARTLGGLDSDPPSVEEPELSQVWTREEPDSETSESLFRARSGKSPQVRREVDRERDLTSVRPTLREISRTEASR